MKLLDQIRHAARVKHFSIRTERCYVQWAERYIRFHGIKHPNTMGTLEIEQFLTHLAVEGNVSASTQNQALAALLFLYQEVMKIDVGRLDAVRAAAQTRAAGAVAARGRPAADGAGRTADHRALCAHGPAHVWRRATVDGMLPAAPEGY